MQVRTVIEKDAIPSIDDPVFDDSYIGDADDEVLVLEDDPPRAYPIRILNYHEIVNDRLESTTRTNAPESSGDTEQLVGEPVAVTWCPLCASAVVYERTVGGQVLTFGVSGKLADDDLVMYDHETGSEWKQSLGECIAGPLKGQELTVRPAGIISWATFTEEYPDGVVLQPANMESEAASDTDEPAPVEYEEDPYREYFQSDGFGLGAHREDEGRTWERDDLEPKTVVLGIEHGGEVMGYPEPRVRTAGGVLTDTVGGAEVVIFAAEGSLHAFENPGYDFVPVEAAESAESVETVETAETVEPAQSTALTADRFCGDGTVWDPTTGESEDGRQLTRFPARRLFAFTWQDDHGADAFYR